ncbi:MAG TPA: PASTA domain-containing protein [Candidatus Acidoferrales bacterium]|nr:PASTA domain-containing protein [Candidatus Acidoferrales bacterium]
MSESLRERLHWIMRMALLLFILASVAFLSAILAMRFAIQGREVTVPDVVGRNAIEARQILQGRGIGITVEDRVYSAQPVDDVVRQSPPPNMRVKIGEYAHVVLSLGPQRVTIPVLHDRSLRSARIELLRGGMQVGEISSAYLPLPGPDLVLQQDPAAGEANATSPRVNLLVSLGSRPAAYVMPDLRGLPLAEAEAKLRPDGFKSFSINLATVPGVAHGIVAGQKPGQGQKLQTGANIELEVAE